MKVGNKYILITSFIACLILTSNFVSCIQNQGHTYHDEIIKMSSISNCNSSNTNFTLTINIDGNGFVNVSPNNETYEYGTIVKLNATPALDWIFEYWSGDLATEKNPTEIIMNSNKTVNATFRLIPTILSANIEVLPWSRLRFEMTASNNDVRYWREGELHQVIIKWEVNNPHDRLDDTHLYIRLREWLLNSAFPKLLFFLTDSGNLYCPTENDNILGINFLKLSIPLDEGYNSGEEIIEIGCWEEGDNCHLGGFAVTIDNRMPNFWNFCWTGNDIFFN